MRTAMKGQLIGRLHVGMLMFWMNVQSGAESRQHQDASGPSHVAGTHQDVNVREFPKRHIAVDAGCERGPFQSNALDVMRCQQLLNFEEQMPEQKVLAGIRLVSGP